MRLIGRASQFDSYSFLVLKEVIPLNREEKWMRLLRSPGLLVTTDTNLNMTRRKVVRFLFKVFWRLKILFGLFHEFSLIKKNTLIFFFKASYSVFCPIRHIFKKYTYLSKHTNKINLRQIFLCILYLGSFKSVSNYYYF